MNPDVGQIYALSNVDKAYTSETPTLLSANIIFGRGTAEIWIIGQLANLCEFCGSKDAMSQWQLNNLASMIVAMVPYLKMSEMLLFFGRFKFGTYGHFYGNVDPMRIGWALNKFIRQRDLELEGVNARQQAAKDAEEAKKFHCSYEEWLKIKEANEQAGV